MERSIGIFFDEDHRRLDRLFEEFQNETDGKIALERLLRWSRDLTRHIRWEEDALFPFFEAKIGLKDLEMIESFRDEHRQIGSQLKGLLRAVQGGSGFQAPAIKLFSFTVRHHLKEDEVFYPLLDRMTGERERSNLFDKIQTLAFRRLENIS